MTQSAFQPLSTVAKAALIAALSLLFCLLAQLASAGHAHQLLLWPAGAVGFAFGWRHGKRWVALAGAGAGLWGLLSTRDASFAAVCAAASVAGPMLALSVLQRLAQWRPVEYQLQGTGRFLAVTLGIAAAVDAVVFVVASRLLLPDFPEVNLAHLLLGAWVVDALGILLVAPALLAFLDDRPDGAATQPFGVQLFDLSSVLAGLAVAGVSYLLARWQQPYLAQLTLYAAIPVLAWSATRVEERGHALTQLLVSLPLIASEAYQLMPRPAATASRVLDPAFAQALELAVLMLCGVLVALLLQAVSADRRLAIQRVAQQSRRDLGTGLLNDRGLLAEISDRLVAPDRDNIGLISLHLTNFDGISDLCGTIEAIHLEQACADLLRRQAGLQFAARLAPGRYVMVASSDTVAQVRAIARELYSQLAGQLFQTEHGSLRLQCCAGGLLLDRHTVITSEDCLSALADATSIAASVRDPRLFVEPLSQMMIDARRSHQSKIEHIREAIRDNRIELFAQPVIDPDAPPGRRSFELLTRLVDKDGGLIQPPEFLMLAAQAQMSMPLDRAVVRRAFEWLASHPNALEATWKCSINLSGATMSDGSIADFIREQRAALGIPADRIVFEITESEAIRNPACASRLVDDLKSQGFGIALDDFGTGLATFEYLKRFPLDYLKIDGSFIRNLLSNPIDEEIVMSTIRVAARLKLRTVAEHVHNGEVCARLRSLGIDHLQGDFFGKPMPLAEFFSEIREAEVRPLSNPA